MKKRVRVIILSISFIIPAYASGFLPQLNQLLQKEVIFLRVIGELNHWSNLMDNTQIYKEKFVDIRSREQKFLNEIERVISQLTKAINQLEVIEAESQDMVETINKARISGINKSVNDLKKWISKESISDKQLVMRFLQDISELIDIEEDKKNFWNESLYSREKNQNKVQSVISYLAYIRETFVSFSEGSDEIILSAEKEIEQSRKRQRKIFEICEEKRSEFQKKENDYIRFKLNFRNDIRGRGIKPGPYNKESVKRYGVRVFRIGSDLKHIYNCYRLYSRTAPYSFKKRH